MGSKCRTLVRILAWVALGAGGLSLIARPGRAPGVVLANLAMTAWPFWLAFRGARGTALGAAVVWGAVAMALGAVGQSSAMGEPVGSGRPGAAAWAYLSALSALAALISVFNARRPGGGAWAILMALLVVLFCLPWLEGSGPARLPGGWGPPRLDPPWGWFYGLLVLAGASNYLPTRYGPAAAVLAAALGMAAWPSWSPRIAPIRGPAVAWTMAVAAWVAELRSARPHRRPRGADRIWSWFRDHWGVVWALRVQERFDRAAEAAGWPVRLSWIGVEAGEGGSPSDWSEEAEATLKGLMRRFADRERIDREGSGE